MSDNPGKVAFEGGYLAGWKICIPISFAASIETKTFAVGDLFYDTPHGYENTWTDALKHFGLCIQVQAIGPAGITYALFKPNRARIAVVQLATNRVTIDEFLKCLKEGFD